MSDMKRCPVCWGRGTLRCDCWPGDCICGGDDEPCEECAGIGWIDPDWEYDDPVPDPPGNLSEARGVRVKPLVWEDQPGGSYCWTQGLHYYTEGSDAEQDWYVSCMIYDDDVWQGENQSTRAAAKAAAQADYEARIIAALEVTP